MTEIDGCCPAAYVCPTTGEVECMTHGGFDRCCADQSCPGWRPMPWTLRQLWIEARHLAVMAGYWIRPYSDVVDRRVWRWRRPRCQFFGGRPWELP